MAVRSMASFKISRNIFWTWECVTNNFFDLYFYLIKRHPPCIFLIKQLLTLLVCFSNKVLSTNVDYLCNFSFNPSFPTSQNMYVQDLAHETLITNHHTLFHYYNIVFPFHGMLLILQISDSSAMPQIHGYENCLLDSFLFYLHKINCDLGLWMSSS